MIPTLRRSACFLPHRVLLGILFLAVGARLYGLTYHSLWFDEVMSVFWASKPAAEIWRVGLALTQDKHPPLYYLALHGWMALFGGSDAAVRLLGVIIGALAVLPAYGIGKIMGDRHAGALGALLLAFNPFLVWYSQEARMFMPATTFGLVGLWGVGQLANCRLQIANRHSPAHGSWLIAICYLLFAICGFTLALYTYLFSAFLLPVAAAWALSGWWLHRKESDAGWRLGLNIVALAVVALLFLPLARSAWSVSGGEATPGRIFGDMAPAVWRMLQVYTVGWPIWPQLAQGAVVAGGGMLALSGLAVRGAPVAHRRWHGLFLFLWLALPVAAGGLLLARDRTVFAETRYFIFLAPALCLAWGRALAWFWDQRRVVGLALTALTFGVTLAALSADWSPANRREAWRETAAFVQAHAAPDDAILIQADYVHVAFTRYFKGSQPVFHPFTERLTDPDRVAGPLNGLAGYNTVWLVQSHMQDLDPDNLVAGWFAARYPQATELFPAGIAVRAFVQHYRAPAPAAGCPTCGQTPPPVEKARATLADNQLHLLTCSYTPGTLSPREDVFHPPSNWVHVTTFWRVGDKLPDHDIFPLARLVDSGGQVWGESLARPNDAFHLWPTSRWLPGEAVRMDYDVNLNPVTPAGAYRLVIEAQGTQAPCGDVTITDRSGF